MCNTSVSAVKRQQSRVMHLVRIVIIAPATVRSLLCSALVLPTSRCTLTLHRAFDAAYSHNEIDNNR